MRRRWIPVSVMGVLVMVAVAVVSCGSPSTREANATPVPTWLPTGTPPSDSWILVDLPPDATQLQHGAEIYRLVCSACHAYSGEGLTDAWRATWDPKDQNCWQSKCHAANHPPDGFELPVAPAVAGKAALASFVTAANLHDYIQSAMPWQDPNSLTEEESWAVTAYIIKLNRMNPGPNLNAETASKILLHPGGMESGATPTAKASGHSPGTSSSNSKWAFTGALLGLIAALLSLWAVRVKRTQQ